MMTIDREVSLDELREYTAEVCRHKSRQLSLLSKYLLNIDKTVMLKAYINSTTNQKNAIRALTEQIAKHDMSKLEDLNELEMYTINDDDAKYKLLTGAEYLKARLLNDPGFVSHIQKNPHHPEYWYIKNNLIDDNTTTVVPLTSIMPITYFIEMVLDWCAAATYDGEPLKLSTCKEHQKRFNIDDYYMKLIYKEIEVILNRDEIEYDI